MEQESIRINKFLSEAGICSRRGADRMVEDGRVTINGVVAQLGDRIQPGQKVCVDGKPVSREDERILLAYHKPKGIVCTSAKKEKNNIIDYLNYPKRIYPIGRLDKDSEGLLLLTNDGELANEIMKARNYHEKEYEVTVSRPVTETFLRGMAGGVPILDTMTRKCQVEQTGKRSFRIVLTQGLNRQIRRMCEYFGYRVTKLVRVRIMNIYLGDLPVGKYRELTEKEWAELSAALKKDEEK
ncbi:MAG: 23S rRNA pseudouridine(2604) synthase RluF [Lachnospiraceae bacterium]|nr:23S rRNA pseudouridine(2604) synthase RluF [Lachnospiraceae bacterium]MDD7377679.1 23S rRNA pseudouridine(2604) synthase RluF [Lachnospiraceae bacterium]MDY4616261.1 23S rRNA pseudouridine(2604) synthase RluF [Lachnospiraceae bacterium]